MPVDAFTLLFQTASSLTGGLVNDMSTALVVILVIMFVVLGVDLLRDVVLDPYFHGLNQEQRYKKYKEHREEREYFTERYKNEKQK
jgi:hypothetical protein